MSAQHKGGTTGCAKLPPDESSSARKLLLLLLIGCAVYVGGGVLLGWRAKGVLALAAHPHYRRWRELFGLATDGVSFAASSSSRRGRSQGGGEARGARSYVAAPSEAPSKEAKQKKGKSGKKKTEKTRQGETSPVPAVTPASSPPEWQPTRTGHLAVGARETGVKTHY